MTGQCVPQEWEQQGASGLGLDPLLSPFPGGSLERAQLYDSTGSVPAPDPELERPSPPISEFYTSDSISGDLETGSSSTAVSRTMVSALVEVTELLGTEKKHLWERRLGQWEVGRTEIIIRDSGHK